MRRVGMHRTSNSQAEHMAQQSKLFSMQQIMKLTIETLNRTFP
jgi:hypothetical protein